MQSVIDSIRLEDLDDDQRQLAEIVGLESYKELIRTYGGFSVYIPKPDSFVASARNEQIRKEFDGYNYRELAKKHGLSEVWVRNIVADRVKEVRGRPPEGQISLFDSPQE